jgi:hypothetical protein
MQMLRAIYSRHTTEWVWRADAFDRLAGSDRLRLAVMREGGIEALAPILEAESRRFAEEAKRFWLYR